MKIHYNKEEVLKFAQLSKLAPLKSDSFDKYLSFFKENDFNDVLQLISDVLSVNINSIQDSEDELEFLNRSLPIHQDITNFETTKEKIMSNAFTDNDFFITPKSEEEI